MLNGAVVAESDRTEVVEGNHYFPPGSVNGDYLRESQTQTYFPTRKTYTAEFYAVLDGEGTAVGRRRVSDTKFKCRIVGFD